MYDYCLLHNLGVFTSGPKPAASNKPVQCASFSENACGEKGNEAWTLPSSIVFFIYGLDE